MGMKVLQPLSWPTVFGSNPVAPCSKKFAVFVSDPGGLILESNSLIIIGH